MTSPLQQFSLDLKEFGGDLRDFLSGRHLRRALAGRWQDLRQDRELQLPVIFTVTVHLGALLLSLAGPLLLAGRVRIPEVYRVELYNAVEQPPAVVPAPVAPPTPVAKPSPTPKTPPPTIKTPAKTAPPKVSVPAAKPKAISLSPIKKRLLKEREEQLDMERQAKLLDLRMAELKLAQKRKEAEDAAKEAANNAVSKIADLYRSTPPPGPADSEQIKTTPATAAVGASGGSGEVSPQQLEAIERYIAQLKNRIYPNWQLPDLQNWDETLEARIVLKMRWDGSVDTTWFEKRSGNYRFDEYVKKAIDNSIPLPPLPPELNRKSEEIAVTFTPGGLR